MKNYKYLADKKENRYVLAKIFNARNERGLWEIEYIHFFYNKDENNMITNEYRRAVWYASGDRTFLDLEEARQSLIKRTFE